MKEHKRKGTKKQAAHKPPAELSASKKRFFWMITLSIPLVIFVLLETGLQAFNYSGNLSLFIVGPEGYENYFQCNPNVARRYFYLQTAVPTPPKQLFLKDKPKNGYRIFVLGESSAAGFPYSNNASFPNILRRQLSNAFPEKYIEVINISMSAINTYTLLDLTDEILKQSPDALLIYTGHNEYYGALGVGSTQSMGNSRRLIQTYLKFQSVKTVLLMRDFLGWIKVRLSQLLYSGSEIDPSATLMDRMVSEQIIPFGSPLYEAGKEQFRENIESIIRKASLKGVRVILSELVSNLHDQEPFISLEEKKNESAQNTFIQARQYEQRGDFYKAKQSYIRAKDLDALRFRAPEDFNKILRDLAKKYSLTVAPTLFYFEKESPLGVIGESLMLEHVHPNIRGYHYLAKAFYDIMEKEHFISDNWPQYGFNLKDNNGITELDSVYGEIVIKHLKCSWPFQPKSVPNRFLENFKASNHIEQIALRILPSKNFNLEAGHMELGNYYEKLGLPDKALAEYKALIASIPNEIEFYQKAATVLIKQKEYDKASKLLQESLKYKESSFANKWLGQIALMNNNYKDAVTYLLKADPQDPQAVFNLSRAYYLDNQWYKGEEHFRRLKNLSPVPEYISFLNALRASMQINNRQ